MLVSIHTLQNHPAANLNRDDTGAPKTQYFGGYERAFGCGLLFILFHVPV